MPAPDFSTVNGQLDSYSARLSDIGSSLDLGISDTDADKVPLLSRIDKFLSATVTGISNTKPAITAEVTEDTATNLIAAKKELQSLSVTNKALLALSKDILVDIGKQISPVSDNVFTDCSSLKDLTTELDAYIQSLVVGVNSVNHGANSQLTDMVSEIQNLADALASYSADMAAYLESPDTTTMPILSIALGNLTAETILSYASMNMYSAVDMTAGAMSSTVYKVAGLVRELAVRNTTKSLIYAAGITELDSSSSFVYGESGKTLAELRGMTPAQSEGA